eukprot:15298355-Alexandrium_andersonii.AAC.1
MVAKGEREPPSGHSGSGADFSSAAVRSKPRRAAAVRTAMLAKQGREASVQAAGVELRGSGAPDEGDGQPGLDFTRGA